MVSRKNIATAAGIAAALVVAVLGLWFAVSPWTAAGGEAAADASVALARSGHAPVGTWVVRWGVLIFACAAAGWGAHALVLRATSPKEGSRKLGE